MVYNQISAPSPLTILGSFAPCRHRRSRRNSALCVIGRHALAQNASFCTAGGGGIVGEGDILFFLGGGSHLFFMVCVSELGFYCG